MGGGGVGGGGVGGGGVDGWGETLRFVRFRMLLSLNRPFSEM